MILVGTFDGNAKVPGVKCSTAFGASYYVQFCVVGRQKAERRDVARERHLYLATRIAADERYGDLGELNSFVIRAFLQAPEQLLLFLYCLLQASAFLVELEDRCFLECCQIRTWPRVVFWSLRSNRHRGGRRKSNQDSSARDFCYHPIFPR